MPPIGAHGRPDINPYERDIDMTVPLMYRGRSLGDIPVRLTFDDQFFVQTTGFMSLIAPLVSDAARTDLQTKLGSRPTFTADDLAQTGVALIYDPASLAVVVLEIAPERRAVERLFAPPPRDTEQPDILPAHFSAYLNLSAVQSVVWNGGDTPLPSFGLNGAIRLGRFVFEGDGALGDTGGFGGSGGYAFERNYARLVFDEPTRYRRWLVGDLNPEVRGQQGYVPLGGFGVVRSRQRFNDFQSAILQSNRQLVLQRPSNLRIIRNGVLFRDIRLDAGTYDLSSLPLITGSNDIQIQVNDDNGRVQTLSYQQYLDPIDLEPGDYEYGAYVGRTSTSIGGSPDYNGPLSFSGFFRKSFFNRPAIGVGLQFNRQIQNITGQTQFIIGGGGRLLFNAGISNSRQEGIGYSGGVSYDQLIYRGNRIDSFSIRADYLSRRYGGLGNPNPNNSTSFSFNGQYNRALSESFLLLFSANYVMQRNGGDNYRIGASINYNIDRRWSLRGGVDYSRIPGFSNNGGFGFTVSLIYQPNYRSRAEARYDSSIDSGYVSYLRASSNQIGSVGYGASINRDDSRLTGSGYIDYIANRFDASVSHSSSGNGLSSIGDTNITTVRVTTSLAFADGAFGIGRRINDSFAILYPHPTLGGRTVVAGQSLARNEYISASGTFGGAVNNYLTSYIPQSVQYDVRDPPTGYDIGPGVLRVRPSYRSGYAIQVGTDAFVTALGTLLQPNGQPVSLAGGRATALDRPDLQPVAFFTNAVGRFGVAGLRPGLRYKVELYTPRGAVPAFEFTVPQDTDGLVNLRTVTAQRESEVPR